MIENGSSFTENDGKQANGYLLRGVLRKPYQLPENSFDVMKTLAVWVVEKLPQVGV